MRRTNLDVVQTDKWVDHAHVAQGKCKRVFMVVGSTATLDVRTVYPNFQGRVGTVLDLPNANVPATKTREGGID